MGIPTAIAGIAALSPAPGSRARSSRTVPLGSFAELSCQKIVFDLQLANLPIQDIDLCLAGPTLGRATAVKNTGRAVQQLLFPIVDLVRMNPELARQLGDRPVAPCLRRGKLLTAANATFAPGLRRGRL